MGTPLKIYTRREATQAEIYTKMELKNRGLKPKEGARSKGIYRNYYKVQCDLYSIEDSEPLEIKPPRKPKKIKLHTDMEHEDFKESYGYKTSQAIAELLEQNPIFCGYLNVSTELWDIAIIDMDGNILFQSRLKPTLELSREDQIKYGISPQDFKDCPEWQKVTETLKNLLIGRKCLIFSKSHWDCLNITAKVLGENLLKLDIYGLCELEGELENEPSLDSFMDYLLRLSNYQTSLKTALDKARAINLTAIEMAKYHKKIDDHFLR